MNDSTNDSTDAADELERELQAMTPRGLSDAARQHIAHELFEISPRRNMRVIVSVAVAVAASVLLLAWWLTLQPRDDADDNIAAHPKGINTGTPEDMGRKDNLADIAAVGDDSLPTLWAYRRAANKSFDDLDQLLAQHGRSSMGGDTPLGLNEIGFD